MSLVSQQAPLFRNCRGAFFDGPPFFAKLKNFFAKLIFSRQNFFWYFGKGKSFCAKKNLAGQKST
jgi:hypothetical protein